MANDFDIDAFDESVEDSGSTDVRDSGLDVDDETEDEYRDAPNVNFRPTIVVDVESVERFDFNGRIDHEQNLYKPNKNEPGSQFLLGLNNPSVQYGEVWEATNGHSADIKVLSSDADDVELDTIDVDSLPDSVDVEDMDEDELTNGVTISTNQFKSQKVPDLPNKVTLWQGGRAGEFIARFLDVIGGGGAYYNGDDDKANALFEYNPSDGGEPELRVSRTPTLREDLIDQPLRFYYKFGGGNSHQVQVLRIPEVGAGEDEGEPLEPIYADSEKRQGEPEYNSYVYWDENNSPNGDSSSEDGSDDDDGSDDSDVATSDNPDVRDTDSDDVGSSDNPFANTDNGDTYDPMSYAELNDADTVYVHDIIEMWEDSPVSDMDDIREAISFEDTYEGHIAEDDGPSGEVDVDTMATIINEQYN